MDNKKYSMSWYFDKALDRKAILLDGSNLNWFAYPLFDCIKDEINRTLNSPQPNMDWGYTYPGGLTKFRELIALHESFIEKTGIEKEDVIIGGNGVTGVINFICRFLSEEAKKTGKNELIYPVPSYSGLLMCFSSYDLKPVVVQTEREENFCISFDTISEKFNKKTAAILITNPNNPACCYFNDNKLKKIFEFAVKNDLYIILDAIFEESPSRNPKFIQAFNITKNYNKLIKIKGFSKDIPQLSDLRLGWSISKNKNFNDKMLEYGEATNYSNSSFLEELGKQVMQHRVWLDQGIENESVAKYKSNLEYYHKKIFYGLDKALELLGKSTVFNDHIIPDAGNIIFASIDKDICIKKGIYDSHELFLYILEKTNILVTPGHVFGLDFDKLWFRITVSKEPEVVFDSLKQIERLFMN